MTTDNPHLYNVDTLAAYLGHPRSFVYKLTSAGKIGHLKVGRELRFTPAHVQTYLDACEQTRPHNQPARGGRPRKSAAR